MRIGGPPWLARGSAACLALVVSAGTALALEVGEPAPPFPSEGWVNVPKGEEPPTPERLKGKVVLVEFFFAKCGPCIRAVPHLHELKDRYGPRGLHMVSIARDSPGAVEDFVKEHDFRLPVLCDPDSEVIEQYGIRGFPSTAVIDAEGKVAYLASPYDAEQAVEKALGLETSPGSCLKAYFAALEKKDATAVRSALERLCEKATPKFDLKAWAGSAGVETPEKVPPLGAAGNALTDYGKACTAGAADKRTALLGSLATHGPAEFDLEAWAKEGYVKAYPLGVPELKSLIEEKRLDVAVDALIDRRPSGAVLDVAAKSVPLAVHASKNADDERSMARKGLLALHWCMAGKPAEDNEGYWKDISVSGMATSEDRTRVVGVLLGGAMVLDTQMPAWIDRRLSRWFVMDALKDGKKPALSQMREAVKKERGKILKELEARYPFAKPPKEGDGDADGEKKKE